MQRFFASQLWFLLIVFFGSAGPLHAQEPGDSLSNRLHPQKIEEDFDITAKLSNPAWNQAEPVYIKHEIQPNDQAAAPVKTEVRVLYSNDYLYVGFISHDPDPSKIRASISDRDASFRDDFVGIFLDTFNNNQQAYEFFINPLGVQMDGMRTGNSEDMNFDALWYSRGTITDSGYRAVMKIPFKSINFPKRNIQNWSIQFIRNYPRSNRHQLVWTDVSLDNSCLMCQNGTLVGMSGLESSNTVELLPYAMGYQNSMMKNPGMPSSGLDHEAVNGRVGGSISYSPSSTISLDAVVNPDFSQVETDEAQIGVNETFALYYPEKRPFFMKGADLFQTEENLYYSRMINRPLAAGKFTQKSSNYSIAFLSAYDRSTPFIIPGKYGSALIRSDVDSYSNIVRGKYNIGDESFVGGLLTTRNHGEGANYVGSVDWRLNVADHYYFNGQVAYSGTRELSDPQLFGSGRTLGESSYDAAFNGQQYGGMLISAEFERQAKYYSAWVNYASYSPTFQSQVGFINRTDRREYEAGQRFAYYPDTGLLSRGSVSVSGTWRYDFSGQFQERYIFLRLNNNFAGQTRVSLSYLPLNDEQFRGRFFTGMRRWMINVNTNPLDGFSIGGHIDFGRYVNRAQTPTTGEGYNISVNATVKPTTRLQFDASYSYSTLSSTETGANYYSGDVMRLTSRYNFSRRFFARVITQYNSFSEQIQLYPLLYYKVNPFTKFYIGMTDNINHFDQPGGINGYRQTSRQFFVKFQYLIRS